MELPELPGPGFSGRDGWGEGARGGRSSLEMPPGWWRLIPAVMLSPEPRAMGIVEQSATSPVPPRPLSRSPSPQHLQSVFLACIFGGRKSGGARHLQRTMRRH